MVFRSQHPRVISEHFSECGSDTYFWSMLFLFKPGLHQHHRMLLVLLLGVLLLGVLLRQHRLLRHRHSVPTLRRNTAVFSGQNVSGQREVHGAHQAIAGDLFGDPGFLVEDGHFQTGHGHVLDQKRKRGRHRPIPMRCFHWKEKRKKNEERKQNQPKTKSTQNKINPKQNPPKTKSTK